MHVLLFGSRGYLGEQFRKLYPDALMPTIDIADAPAVSHILDQERPAIVINAAGKTGRPNVDWCEDHKEETIRSNVTGPLVLLEECLKRGIYWVHLSTGCMYEGTPHQPSVENFLVRGDAGQVKGAEGTEGFSEDDPPNFFGSFYSRSKGWIDQILKEFPVLQLRLRMPFDASNNERNLLVKLAKYSRVLAVKNSMTYLPDFLIAVKHLIDKRAVGIFNVVNPGAMSPYEIMEMYRKIVDPSHSFERLTLQDLPSAVKAGRSNCILSTEKLKEEGIRLKPVQEAVEEALKKLKIAEGPCGNN